MKKIKPAPNNHIYFDETVQKIRREDLDDAGVVFDYLDESYENKKEDENLTIRRKNKKIKKYRRCILFIILILFVTIIMKLGWSQMPNTGGMDNNHSNWNSCEKIIDE